MYSLYYLKSRDSGHERYVYRYCECMGFVRYRVYLSRVPIACPFVPAKHAWAMSDYLVGLRCQGLRLPDKGLPMNPIPSLSPVLHLVYSIWRVALANKQALDPSVDQSVGRGAAGFPTVCERFGYHLKYCILMLLPTRLLLLDLFIAYMMSIHAYKPCK